MHHESPKIWPIWLTCSPQLYMQPWAILTGGTNIYFLIATYELLQVIELPAQQDSQLKLEGVLKEVIIMEMFADDPGICKLLDFGVTPEGFNLTMPLYSSDLASWRSRLPVDVEFAASNEKQFLRVFSQVCHTLTSLSPG